jgi:DNA-directed RNA polymerase specialized sigma24 family protein
VQQLRTDTATIFRAWIARAATQLSVRPRFAGRPNWPSEEAMAEALSKAWNVGRDDPDYFDSYAHLVNWLKQTARWKHIDRFRRGQRHRSRRLPADWADDPAPPGRDRWTPEDVGLLWDCLLRLSDEDREVLLASYFDGLTDARIGGRLFGPAASPRALGLRVWRLRQAALVRLRRLLRAEGVGADHAYTR